MHRTLTILVTMLLVASAVPPAASTASSAGPVSGATDAEEAQESTCSFPVEVTDATGTTVRIESEPKRIVTLGPSAAQTMWEIGGREKVVGVSQYASYLEGAETRTNVSGAGEAFANVETVVGLEPDLVLAPNIIPEETVEKLRSAGLTVYRFDQATSIQFVVEKTRLTGNLTGECAGADRVADRMESELRTVRRAVEGERRPKAIYVFFGFTAGEGTFIDELITTAGGRNVAAESGITGYKEISPETVVQQDPEWIVLNEDQPTVPETDAYNATTAVQEGNTVVLDRNYLSQPAPRIMQPLRKLARTFHPEAYAAANAMGTPTPETRAESPTAGSPTTTETATGQTATTPESPGATGTDSPGLGFGVVVATLLLWSLVLVRYADGAARRP
jgi:iron complex transport system substrate-binding protein